MRMKVYKNTDAYIADFPKETQKLLKELRKTIKSVIPKAEEKIAYGIPTYKLHKNVVHFAGYKTHIGFYPGSRAIVQFAKQLKPYDLSKGTVRFPFDKKLPLNLIKEIVKYNAVQQSIDHGY